jgi:hypothetical protein
MPVRALALSGLLFGACLACAQNAKLEFKEYTSKEGKYKVLMPGEVKVRLDKSAVELTIHSATSEPAPGKILSVTFFDQLIAPGEKGGKALLASFAADLKEDGWKIHTDKATTVGKNKLRAQDLLVEKDNSYLRHRYILSGLRVYQLSVAGPKDFLSSKDADRFIESFEIIK